MLNKPDPLPGQLTGTSPRCAQILKYFLVWCYASDLRIWTNLFPQFHPHYHVNPQEALGSATRSSITPSPVAGLPPLRFSPLQRENKLEPIDLHAPFSTPSETPIPSVPLPDPLPDPLPSTFNFSKPYQPHPAILLTNTP